MVNTVWVKADHGSYFNPLADHMTKLRSFAKEENRDFLQCNSMFTSVNG